MLDSLSLGMTGIVFYVHHSKGALKRRESTLPCDDGAFPTI
jgi:hypothetical protein